MDNLQRDNNQDMKRELEELEEKVVCIGFNLGRFLKIGVPTRVP
jgi:hypothetical protein